MSNFTTQLRYICESFAGYTEMQPASKINNVIADARPFIFDFDYPHAELTEAEKEHLEKHILLHYYMQEIGQETIGNFKYYLQSKLWDIMPKYEQLYATTHLTLDFFNDVDYTRKLDSTTTDEGEDRKTGSIESQNSGTIEFTKDGSIINENTGDVTNVKTGNEEIENDGYTESTQTGSITTDNDNTLTRSESGSYSDAEVGSTTKVTTGGYTDSTDNTNLNLISDTPQSSVNIATNDYVSNVQKQTTDSDIQRVYNNLTETTTPNNKTTTRTFNNRETEDVTDGTTEQTFNNVKLRNDDNTTSTHTFNNVTDTRTDDLRSETSFDDYKETTEDKKKNVQTFNNLLNEMEKENVVDLTERIYGNVTGNNIKKLKEYRENIINIEFMIIKDLQTLFFGLYM